VGVGDILVETGSWRGSMGSETVGRWTGRGIKSGVIGASITNRIQEIEEKISGTEDTIENTDTIVKENEKCKKILSQNIQEIQDIMRRPNLLSKRSQKVVLRVGLGTGGLFSTS
jgi:hypothetical protein